MKNLKSHFWYNKRQRNGIFFLLLLIVVFQLIYLFVIPITTNASSIKISDQNSNDIKFFQQQLDSLRLVELENRKPKIYPFNPSFITDYKGSKLGMSTKEIDRLLDYRSKGKYINSTKQFQSVTKISDSLLAVISPYFKFPDWVVKSQVAALSKRNKVAKSKNEPIVIQDLNTATAAQLRVVYGVGETLSERIVKYRNSIQGFLSNDQLNEVYGLKPEVIDRIFERFTIQSKPTIEKLNVNTATFKEVLRLPYIDYELTKKIFQYREEVAEIQSIEELKNIEGFPLEMFDRIAVYLEAK